MSPPPALLVPGEDKRRRSVGFTYEGLESACHKLTQFVEHPPFSLICDVGKGVMQTPVENPACKHQFCRKCIVNMTRNTSKCPVSSCTATIDHSLLVLQEEKQECINALPIICSNKAKGCEWQGPINDFAAHLKECKLFLPITCEMCKCKVRRDEMAAHASHLCPRLPTVCPHCDESVLVVELEAHIADCVHAEDSDILESNTMLAIASGCNEVSPAHSHDSIEEHTRVSITPPDRPLHKRRPRDSPPNSLKLPSNTSPSSNCPTGQSTNSRRQSGSRSGMLKRQVAAWGSGSGAGSPSGAHNEELWGKVEELSSGGVGVGAGGAKECADDVLQVLLQAITQLQTRVTSLEAENESLRLIARASPTPLSGFGAGSCNGATLAPLKLPGK